MMPNSSISSITFTVQLADAPDNAPRSARRITIHADVLKSAKIYAGDVLAIASAGSEAAPKTCAVGVAWPSLEMSPTSVDASRSLLLTTHLVDGAKVQIFPLSGSSSSKTHPWLPSLQYARDATVIVLREISSTGVPVSGFVPKTKAEGEKRNWLTLLLREMLVDLKYMTSSQILEVVYEGEPRRFTISNVSQRPGNAESTPANLADDLQAMSIRSSSQLWTVGWDSIVSIAETSVQVTNPVAQRLDAALPFKHQNREAYASVGGLEKQISQIRDLLEIPLTHPELFQHFALKPPRGILLHGPPGTGKTHLARAIAASTRSSVLIINGPELSSAYHGETEAKLRDIFREAHKKSPCIVVLDEVDALVPRREDGAGGEVEKRVVATLLTLLDGMEESGSSRVVVIGTTNRPNAIDPALRRPGRFDREIEIGIPDNDARFSIMSVLLSKTPHSISQDELRTFASRAYGYVGADLNAVVREAGTLAIKRWLSTGPPLSTTSPPQPMLTLADLYTSLPSVRPSALRSLFFESPPVRYSEIGGQSHVIQKLREAVEWPLLHPETFERLGVRAPKGVLLYGPPGCSKTLLVRACACESGVNFVAVKGPELLSKFVGESERAVREIFRKARAASPSIVFFDEIDGLATSRTSTDTESGTTSHEGVLTSLLNEMDGVQELLGVTVVAATNRPDVLDSALLRPGRFDRILYVGPPDRGAREEILKIRMKKMSVGSDVNIEEIANMTAGCSGAEIIALCQEAAMLTMQKDMNSSHVPQEAFVAAARALKRQITPDVIQRFERWTQRTGVAPPSNFLQD